MGVIAAIKASLVGQPHESMAKGATYLAPEKKSHAAQKLEARDRGGGHLCGQKRRVLREQLTERRGRRLLPRGDAQRDRPLHQVLHTTHACSGSGREAISKQTGVYRSAGSIMFFDGLVCSM